MSTELKVGCKIEFESGSKFEVIKIFEDGFVDLRSLEPHELLPTRLLSGLLFNTVSKL